MRIMMVTSEAVPFAKTGGLADVATGLSKALVASEHEVALVMPCYRRHIPESDRGEIVGQVTFEMLHTTLTADIFETKIPDSEVRVFLVDRPHFFDRDGLYLENGHDYGDNAERFLFFSRAAVEVARHFFRPDIIHANDWQTGLVPGLILQEREHQGELGNIGTVYTIHNMAFHGEFPSLQMLNTGMNSRYFNWEQLEYFGNLNLLKGGIAMADIVTTVSPTYAKETCLPEFGYGLDPVLENRGEDYIGILNGVDMSIWNPESDPHIAMQYNFQNYKEGKAECKAALQREMGLPENPEAMVLGLVSRLTDQKGLDLITKKATQILNANVQFAFLGAGDPRYEKILLKLQQDYPDKVAVYIGFQEGLAHRIEAGSDAFLMPSSFEPCGLNQQYSQIYGTPPIVHAVGGLTDSVVDVQRHTLDNGTATGFVFREYDADHFLDTVWRAVGMFVHHTEDWNKLVLNSMVKDSSWDRIAQEYTDVYERVIAKLG
ncbi:glycogen synthase GlgA [Thalassoglobus polymorphus]|uniref:Glycogen synthase n=1 Tax=Thalassoglobus polymorphus TaxID=2527994 RepID=A0A517QKD8_9PLAN|nr:glycogen synthase GlgA [Thalassoglobus polymorphus]QDT32098.1 Glycogen synthase [Thalassoglobus polymorphus]